MQEQTGSQQGSARGRETAPKRYEGLDRCLIDGEWRAGKSGKRGKDVSPWTGETLLEFGLANKEDVDLAYRAADRAWREWWKRTPHERSAVLKRAVQLMEQRKDEIVWWIVQESGGTQSKGLLEWQLARNVTEEASTYPSRLVGQIIPSSIPGMESRVYPQPVGTVLVISPFNFPWQLSMRSVAPALACGNAVVLKPASDTPVCGGTLIGKLFEEAGLPKGLLQVLVGSGKDIGDAIVEHPTPRVVSFTGSTPVGKHLGELCGKGIKKACLELGGNAPMVIFDDADLDVAVDATLFGKFSHQGQICMATNRILVQKGIYDGFVERFLEKTRKLVVGERDNPKTVIGPIINASQRDDILDRVKRSVAAGARVALEGKPQGLVIPPVVLVGVTNEMPCAKEENFGPVAPILAFDSNADGVRLANDTWAGLSAAVCTQDRAKAEWAASAIDAGMVHINDSSVDDEPNTAFGGMKQSGLGRFGGHWAIGEFTEPKWVSVMLEKRQFDVVGGGP